MASLLVPLLLVAAASVRAQDACNGKYTDQGEDWEERRRENLERGKRKGREEERGSEEIRSRMSLRLSSQTL